MCSDDPDVIPTPSDDVAIRQLHDINWIVSFHCFFRMMQEFIDFPRFDLSRSPTAQRQETTFIF